MQLQHLLQAKRSLNRERVCDFLKRVGAFSALTLVVVSLLTGTDSLMAQGGCGAVCLPPDILNPGRLYSDGENRFRFFILNEYTEFDNFYEGSDPVKNMGGNSAIINTTTVDANITFNGRLSVDVIVPWVSKTQQTNRFGQRRAEGFGDIAAIGNVLLSRPDGLNRLSARVGLKFANGSVEEPGDGVTKLPNPFQSGSGAEDLFVGANYYRFFRSFSLYSNWLSRLPLTENKFQYKFGNEHRFQAGVEVPLGEKRLVTLLAGLAFNLADHDTSEGTDVPGRIRDGTTVLNTGGQWIDFAPGARFNLPSRLYVQTRWQLPIYENWNGNRETNVGQVRPDYRWQISFGFDLSAQRSNP